MKIWIFKHSCGKCFNREILIEPWSNQGEGVDQQRQNKKVLNGWKWVGRMMKYDWSKCRPNGKISLVHLESFVTMHFMKEKDYSRKTQNLAKWSLLGRPPKCLCGGIRLIKDELERWYKIIGPSSKDLAIFYWTIWYA